jgi:hypothetical protein
MINSSGESAFKIFNTDFNSFDNCNNKIKFNKIYFNIYFRDLLVALSADLKLELPSGFVNIRIFIKSGNAIITSISFETKRNGIESKHTFITTSLKWKKDDKRDGGRDFCITKQNIKDYDGSDCSRRFKMDILKVTLIFNIRI